MNISSGVLSEIIPAVQTYLPPAPLPDEHEAEGVGVVEVGVVEVLGVSSEKLTEQVLTSGGGEGTEGGDESTGEEEEAACFVRGGGTLDIHILVSRLRR